MIILFDTLTLAFSLNTVMTLDMVINLILSIAVAIAAIIVGIYLRRRLVRVLKKTVLDAWIVQTLGAVVLLLLVLIGLIGATAVWNANILLHILSGYFTEQNRQQQLTAIGWKLFETVLLVVLGFGFARTVRALIIRGLGNNHVDINLRTFIGRIFFFIVLIIAALWILTIWQYSLYLPVAAISVITVALSFAIQDILKDLVAGFYLLIERPFYIGDQISTTIAPTVVYIGKVEGIELRATKLRLLSGEEVTIPNGTLFSNVVVNNTYYGERRATIEISIPASDFQHKDTASTIKKILQELDNVIEKPEPMVLFSGYAESKVMLLVHFWIASGQVIDVSEMMYALHNRLPDADLQLKEPVGAI